MNQVSVEKNTYRFLPKSHPLHGLCAREETAVDCIHDRLCSDDFSAEKSPVQPLDGILTALDTVEFEVDVALRVRIYSNVNDVTIFLLTLSADVILQILDPGVSFLTVEIR